MRVANQSVRALTRNCRTNERYEALRRLRGLPPKKWLRLPRASPVRAARRERLDGRRPEKKMVDAGRPLADVFEAVASAQETGRVPVLRAPSRTIEEAASDIKKLVTIENVPPQTRERLKSSQRGAGRRFGCFDGEQAATTLLSEIDYERCLREFENAFEKGHLADFWLAVETRLAAALGQAEHEGTMPHIIRLNCGEGKGAVAIASPPAGRLRRALEKPDNTPVARDDLEPTNPVSDSASIRGPFKRRRERRLDVDTRTGRLSREHPGGRLRLCVVPKHRWTRAAG